MLKFNRRNKRLVIPVGINPNYGIDSSTLYNTDDADIVASDVLEGKVGYGKDGKIIGTLDIQSEKEESYQEGYEFGYNEGNDAGYQLGYDEGNEAGIEIGKAEVIEGMNDATITAGTVFKGEIGYGKDGERIVGDYEFVEGFDFGVIGYSENDSNTANRSISDDIAYSKSLVDQWPTNKNIFKNNLNLVYVPMVDTSNETKLWATLIDSYRISYIPLWDTSNVTQFGLFGAGAGPYPNIKTLPLWDTSNVTDMSYMCSGLSNISSVPLWDTSKVTSMGGMFQDCSNLTTVPLFDTSNVTSMSSMFEECRIVTTVPLFNTLNVTRMNRMFYNCRALTTVPLFDTSNVTRVDSMFLNCQNLTNLDGFTNLGKGFTGTTSLHNLSLSQSSKLTKQSCLNIFNTIYDMTNTSVTDATITLNSTTKTLLLDEDIAIATSKGWIIA